MTKARVREERHSIPVTVRLAPEVYEALLAEIGHIDHVQNATETPHVTYHRRIGY